jgi:alanyl-tRNA synthetase
LLKNTKDISKSIYSLLEENVSLQKQVEEFTHEKVKQLAKELIAKAKAINDIQVVEYYPEKDVDANFVKDLAYEVKNSNGNFLFCGGTIFQGKPALTLSVSDELIKGKQINAGSIIRELAKEIQGGGGGQPFFATAGGKKTEGLKNIPQKLREILL